jgi:2-iminobutanoate/2-iminopropanoate deaminase
VTGIPAAIGPYSHAVWAGDLMFCSGQLGVYPASGALAGTDIVSQARQALENVRTLVESQGKILTDVDKSTEFHTDMGNFKALNEEYANYFGAESPARSCVAVASLPMGALVEIEIIVHR